VPEARQTASLPARSMVVRGIKSTPEMKASPVPGVETRPPRGLWCRIWVTGIGQAGEAAVSLGELWKRFSGWVGPNLVPVSVLLAVLLLGGLWFASPIFHGLFIGFFVYRTLTLRDYLEDGTDVPKYVRPQFDLYHYEFLDMVTPDAAKGCAQFSDQGCAEVMTGRVVSGLVWQQLFSRRK
jgi:hypothetical protein